jgi:putative FmdB family regulatory protein
MFLRGAEMPIFEFACEACGEEFERLIFRSEQDNVACPKCGSQSTRRLLSVFSGSPLEAKAAAGCGSAGGSRFS